MSSFIDDLFNRDVEELAEIERAENEMTDDDRSTIVRNRQREKILNDVMQLYYQGKTNDEIAQELNISYSQVSYAMRIAKTRFQDRSSQDYLAKRAEAVARLRNYQRELWVAWNKSKKIDRKVLIKRATIRANAPAGTANNQEIEEQVEEMAGNIDYFKGILWCEAEISKLEGLHAPKKIANTDAEGKTLPTSAREEILRELEIMRSREHQLQERSNLEAIEAEIIKESEQEVSDVVMIRKPTALLNSLNESEELLEK